MNIEWGTKTINVLKSDMLQTQTTPISVYELDIDLFRADLNDLSDDAEGITYPTTHKHVAPVSVGGVQLARVIEIINGYTITFEDGQYAVNLVGANSNIADRVNVNQVSVRSANSAGLPNLDVLETSAFRGAVSIDETNGRAGTQYPMGTSKFPVNNVEDARTIATTHGLNTILVVGDLTVASDGDISDMILVGQSPLQSTLTLTTGCDVDRAEFREFLIEGSIDGDVVIEDCHIGNVAYSQGIMKNSLLTATVQLGVSGQINFLNCASGTTGNVLPVIDINGVDNLGDCALIFRNYSGGIKLTEKTGSGRVAIDISSGKLVIDSTCVNGSVLVRGDAKVVDHNGDLLNTGVVNTALALTNETYFGLQVDKAFSNGVYLDMTNGTAGTNFPQGSVEFPVNNVDDAVAIAGAHNVKVILFDGVTTVASGEDISGLTLRGLHAGTSTLTLSAGCVTEHSQIENCRVSGTQDGEIFFRDCATVAPIVNFEGIMNRVTVASRICFKGGVVGVSQILECYGASAATTSSSAIEMDFQDGNAIVFIREWTGPMKVTNMTSTGCVLDASLHESRVWLESSNTAGTINIQKLGGVIEDNTNGSTVNLTSVVGSVWDTPITEHQVSGSVGEALNNAGGGSTPSAIADAVWNSDVSTHSQSGSFGELVGKKLLTIGKWLGLR